MSLLTQNGELLLNESAHLYEAGRFVDALNCLRAGLADVRAHAAPLEWRTFCAQTFATHEFHCHPVSRLLRAGPVGAACAQAANGLIADPRVLDVIYALAPHAGNPLPQWELELGFCASLRSRRHAFQRELAELGTQVRYPRVLAVGCGFVREASDVLSLDAMRGGEFCAFDSDAACLDLIQREYAYAGLRTLTGSLRHFIAECPSLGKFDLIYVPTLFDSLDDVQAAALLEALAPLLESSGRILVANFAPQLKDAAYLEACLDCWPVYRGERQLAALAERAGHNALRGQAIFQEETGGSILLDFEAL